MEAPTSSPAAPVSSSPPRPGACACGQAIFDLSGRRMGEELMCAWCGRRYRLVGLERIEALSGKTALSKAAAKPANPNRARGKRAHGPPGGVMPMIGFMLAFNALAIAAVSLLFLKNPDDGTRRAVWDEGFIVAAKSIWPEVAALLLGNLLGFAAWGVFAYRIHKKQLAARAQLGKI